jgi:hypothetical protein
MNPSLDDYASSLSSRRTKPTVANDLMDVSEFVYEVISVYGPLYVKAIVCDELGRMRPVDSVLL